MLLGPRLVLRETLVQEDLQQSEELVLLRGDYGVEAEEGVEVKV